MKRSVYFGSIIVCLLICAGVRAADSPARKLVFGNAADEPGFRARA